MGDSILENGNSPAPENPSQTEPALLPYSMVGPIFMKLFRQAYYGEDLNARKPFAKFIDVTRHLGSSLDTEITKIVCFGLGSVWRAKQTTATVGTNWDISEAEATKRTILRHITAVQMGIAVSSFRNAKSRVLGPVTIVLCDDQYTDKDRVLLEMLKLLKGGYQVKVFSSVDSGLNEVYNHTFVLATTSNFAVRQHILNSDFDVAGMLWTDHAYDDTVEDTKDKLEGKTRIFLKKEYRRYTFNQTCDGLEHDDIGVKLALYFLRKKVPNSMAAERKTLAASTDQYQKIIIHVKSLASLHALPTNTTVASASPKVICQEFLKVLGRTEIEQPMICFNLCACAQFWRYQHYILPQWKWGINKIVCFGLGSFRNVKDNGGPFNNSAEKHTYREVIRDKALLSDFNAKGVDRHDSLQVMLRHVAAIEMASMMKFCSSKRGVEHQLIKHYFKRLSTIQDMPGSIEEISEKMIKKLEKSPPTAGYGGDKDLPDIPVYFHDLEYTAEDNDALGRLSEVMEMAHLPPIKVVDASQHDGCLLIDEHTLVYCVDPDFPVRSLVLATAKPAAMIWRDHGINPEVGDVLTKEVRPLLNNYEEFKLDKKTAPHTIGYSHMYIRKDIVKAAEADGIVPPYPVNFPPNYPHEHKKCYLENLKDMKLGRLKK